MSSSLTQVTFWPTLTVLALGENAMFFISIAPLGAGPEDCDDDELLLFEDPQPAATRARHAAAAGRGIRFMSCRMTPAARSAFQHREDGCVVGQRAALERPGRPGGRQAAREDVVDARAERRGEARGDRGAADVEVTAQDDRRPARPAGHRARGAGEVG